MILINNGANINAQDFCNRTPLHYAAKFHNFEALQFLLYYDANPLITDSDGNTPLDLTDDQNFVAILKRALLVYILFIFRFIDLNTIF